jgi:hypothetical protein
MPLTASDLVLINKADLDSGTDGAGSGTDPTGNGGRVIDLPERSEVGFLFILKESDTPGEPGDADTLGILIEFSVDGGSTYPDVTASRSILGAEAPDDLAAGDEGVKLAVILRTPKADAAQNGVIKCRLTTTASDGSNWGLWGAAVPVQSLRQEWLDNFYDVAA